MKKSVFFILIFATFALIGSACSTKATEAVSIQNQNENYNLIAEGHLQPVNWLDQSFSVSGQVGEILVKDGETVVAGQDLAKLTESAQSNSLLIQAREGLLAAKKSKETLLSSSDLNRSQSWLTYLQAQQQVDDAREAFDEDNSDLNHANLDVALANYELAQSNMQLMDENDGVDPDLLEAVDARIESANAALESAQANIDAQILKASLDGTVVDLSLQPGQQITAGESVIVIADYSNWVIETNDLTELDVTRVEIGQEVEVVLDALPDIKLTGEVTHIDARYEEKRGDITYTATITLDQTVPELRWGMTAAVYFLR